MIKLILAAVLSVSSIAFADPELPFPKHGDEILKEAFPGDKNTREVQYADLSANIQEVLNDIDTSLELGDGYYDNLSYALYEVTDSNGVVVGYLEAGLYSYTEGSEITLAGALITARGLRIDNEEGPTIFNTYSDIDDPAILELPESLHPTEH